MSTASGTRPAWFMLFARTMLFLAFQGLIALVYYLAGNSDAWNTSAGWWTIVMTMANFVCIWLLSRLLDREGLSFRGLFTIKREYLKSDLKAMLLFLLVAGPASFLPNLMLSNALYGGMEASSALMFRTIPLWAGIFSLLIFPITQGLAELPTYFGYAMPRLKPVIGAFMAVSLSALMLSLQHAAAPFLPDARFILFRGLMFLPFALTIGIFLNWRPRLLPYLAIVHVLIDIPTAVFVLST